ncbi:hypothetical protein HanXRQr2_Chr06g0274151 [Helianthus annuus]|uniref:Uncharacterized protein n=1 Tax=Helianthus annuus TaxID=4232 RepID=A0A9K3IVQ9_HELAN|nr:hypothetical protein HanXRQr2_Chr06g0274151 [Helianthus annuus]KAJ0916700.1 hypothetical protein HanPSC8_Chr06g0264821 [Helianthus annuus]
MIFDDDIDARSHRIGRDLSDIKRCKVVRFLTMDLISGSTGVVMGRNSWILASLIMNI